MKTYLYSLLLVVSGLLLADGKEHNSTNNDASFPSRKVPFQRLVQADTSPGD